MTESRINAIVQVGMVVHSVDATVGKYRELLGVRNWYVNYVDTEHGKGRNFRIRNEPIAAKAKIAWANIGDIELELIEPQDDKSIYAEFLCKHGPGVHHLMFGTVDYQACLDHMSKHGIEALASGELQDTRFHLFDTREELGVICEIAQGDALTPDATIADHS